MNLRDAFEQQVVASGYVRDPAQLAVLDALERLQKELIQRASLKPSLLDRLLGRQKRSVRGLYIWGGVGRGKTFLMDLFYQTLPIEAKRRNHFHRIMQEVHDRLAGHADREDPLKRVADDIAAETRVLCFDEFFVSDIGDAMILGGLLNALFDRGVTLVTTSNSHPDDLYRDGLQRQRFLPAIEEIKKHTDVMELEAGDDYRLRILEKAGTYLKTDKEETTSRLEKLFADASSAPPELRRVLPIQGREIIAKRCGKSVVWFDFEEICDGPRSQSDYIEIARWYQAVIISDVPQLTREKEDQARRFIALVDEFYDRRVKLILAAAVDLDKLYTGRRLRFEFERTASRLMEMQTSDYLGKAHIAS